MAENARNETHLGGKGGTGAHPGSDSAKPLPEESSLSPNELDQTDESEKAADITEAGRRDAEGEDRRRRE